VERGRPAPTRTVYDTAVGRTDRCSFCRRRLEACVCPKQAGHIAKADGTVRIWRDRKGRRGKTVTVIKGLPGPRPRLDEVAGTLKRLCGSGGAVTDEGDVEIQGDHRERVADRLRELGFTVKLAGG
jgi:translation initiation factor 1